MADEAVTPAETPDAKRDGPDYISTKPIPVADPIAILTKIVKDGFAASDANDTVIMGQMQSFGTRLGLAEADIRELKEAKNKHSGGIAALSGHDLSTDAQLAQVLIEQAELKKRGFWGPFFDRVDRLILTVWRDPKVRVLVITALLATLARFGIHIEVPK